MTVLIDSSWMSVIVFGVMVVWILVHVVASIIVGGLIWKVMRLIEFIDERAKAAARNAEAAAEDRKLTKELLVTVKGWAVTVEANDEHKKMKIQQVADTATKTACEMKQALAEAVTTVSDTVACRVGEMLDKKTANDSNFGVPLTTVRPEPT